MERGYGPNFLQKMKFVTFSTFIVGSVILAGCGSEQSTGYDSASREAAEAMAKNGNDITKLTPEQRSALENAAKASRPESGVTSPIPTSP